MADENDDIQKKEAEAKQQREQAIKDEAKPLLAKGFSKEQIGQQLAAKHGTSAAEIAALLEQDDTSEKKAT
jgi:hypothetical protein